MPCPLLPIKIVWGLDFYSTGLKTLVFIYICISNGRTMKQEYLMPDIETMYLALGTLCENSPQPGGIEDVDYEDWVLN